MSTNAINERYFITEINFVNTKLILILQKNTKNERSCHDKLKFLEKSLKNFLSLKTTNKIH